MVLTSSYFPKGKRSRHWSVSSLKRKGVGEKEPPHKVSGCQQEVITLPHLMSSDQVIGLAHLPWGSRERSPR